MHTHVPAGKKRIYVYDVRPAGGDNRNERKHVPGTLAAYIYYLFIKIIHFPLAYLYIYTSYEYACLRCWRRRWGCWEGPEGNGTWTNIRRSSKGRPASSVIYIYTHMYMRTPYLYGCIYLYDIWTVVGHRPIRLRVVSYADRFWNTVFT